jgi:antibiotic biosynthesis monooxygenase (ABM) superfamily enzyme
MIFLTQLIYVVPGKENEFHEFEAIVLPLLPKYGGELVLRLRPDAASVIAASGEPPYEVHLVRFDTEEGLAAYADDDERKRCLHLKEASVRSALLYKDPRA